MWVFEIKLSWQAWWQVLNEPLSHRSQFYISREPRPYVVSSRPACLPETVSQIQKQKDNKCDPHGYTSTLYVLIIFQQVHFWIKTTASNPLIRDLFFVSTLQFSVTYKLPPRPGAPELTGVSTVHLVLSPAGQSVHLSDNAHCSHTPDELFGQRQLQLCTV